MRRSPLARRALGGDRIARTVLTPPRVLTDEAVWWIDAALSTGTQAVANLGTGGSALNATLGSTGGADSNDPQLLSFAGTPYLSLPGIAGNYASTPDAAGLDLTTEFDIRVRVALTDWTPSAVNTLVAKWTDSTNRTFLFLVDTTGVLQVTISSDGSATNTVSSTVGTGISDGATGWVRVTWRSSDGRVQFFTAVDSPTPPTSWVQLGTDRTLGAAATLFNSTATLAVGNRSGSSTGPASGAFYYAEVRSGIDGTVVAKFEPGRSVEPHASWTATTGETWTVNRTASGRKAVLVDRSLWLLGTDDYLEVADSALLDFASGATGTMAVVLRQAATPVSAGTYLAKRTTAAGWALTSSTTNIRPAGILSDGTDTRTGDGSLSSVTAGATHVFSMVRSADNASSVKVDATAMASFGTGTVDDASNSEVMRVGRLSGASTGYQDFTLMAAMVWRRALTDAELDAVYAYYNARRM